MSRDASGDAPPAVAGSFRGPQFEIDARWNVRSGEGGAVEPVLDVTITTVAPSRLAIPGAPWRLSLEPNLDGDAGAELIDARAVRVRGRAALDWTEERARFSVPLGALEGPLRLVVRVPQCQPNTCSMLNATVLLQAPPPSVLP